MQIRQDLCFVPFNSLFCRDGNILGSFPNIVQLFNKSAPSWGLEAGRGRTLGLGQFAKIVSCCQEACGEAGAVWERCLLSSAPPRGPVSGEEAGWVPRNRNDARHPCSATYSCLALGMLFNLPNLSFLMCKGEIIIPSHKIAARIKWGWGEDKRGKRDQLYGDWWKLNFWWWAH